MKACKLVTCILGLLLGLIAPATAADAPPLTFKFTTVNVPGAAQTILLGVNNSGVMVGEYYDKAGVTHGFMLTGKKLTRFDDPNGTSTYGNSLNRVLAVVGSYTDFPNGNEEGFLYKNGKFTDIPGPTGTTASYALGINDGGEIVGSWSDSNQFHGFLLRGKTYTTLDPPGAVDTWATGINNKGDTVLFWVDSKGTTESSFYNGKTYKTIDVPGASASMAGGLNDEGDVVYSWFDSRNLSHGALRHGGKYYKFLHPKSAQTYVGGVNDRRVIVGGYRRIPTLRIKALRRPTESAR